MKVNLILDISTILYQNFHGMKKETDDIITSAANMAAFTSINYYFKEFRPDEVVVAFDGKRNWRKVYTKKSPEKITHRPYKGNRRKGLTKSELAKLEKFDLHVEDFREILKKHTGMLILHHDYLEADDLVSGFVQAHQGPEYQNIVVTRDRDYLQLLRYENTRLFDPIDKKFLDLSEYGDDADFFMFKKCIRGDSSDNVMSSYPRLREDKIKAAYTDEYHLNNLLKHEYTVEEICEVEGTLKEYKYTTEKVFRENELLMDLRRQPPGIRTLIKQTVQNAVEERGCYNMFHFLKFCGKHGLRYMVEDIAKYAPLLKGPSVTA